MILQKDNSCCNVKKSFTKTNALYVRLRNYQAALVLSRICEELASNCFVCTYYESHIFRILHSRVDAILRNWIIGAWSLKSRIKKYLKFNFIIYLRYSITYYIVYVHKQTIKNLVFLKLSIAWAIKNLNGTSAASAAGRINLPCFYKDRSNQKRKKYWSLCIAFAYHRVKTVFGNNS